MPMHSSNGAIPMAMERFHFGNLLPVVLKLVSGNRKVNLKWFDIRILTLTPGHMTSWTDTFTYGTEIAYDFTNILLKYWKNLDLDASSSLNRDEFRISYAKMALLAAHVEMDILDSDSDGIITGNDLKTFITLTQRAANVVLPSKLEYFKNLKSKRPVKLTFLLETDDKYNLVSKMHSQSSITNVADVHNLAKFNSRIMAAFLPEYENVKL